MLNTPKLCSFYNKEKTRIVHGYKTCISDIFCLVQARLEHTHGRKEDERVFSL
jgi:hypothetical protein